MFKNTSSQKGTATSLILFGPVLYFIAASHTFPNIVVTDKVTLENVTTSLPMIQKTTLTGDDHSDVVNTIKK
jgi:hypothetical protein